MTYSSHIQATNSAVPTIALAQTWAAFMQAVYPATNGKRDTSKTCREYVSINEYATYQLLIIATTAAPLCLMGNE